MYIKINTIAFIRDMKNKYNKEVLPANSRVGRSRLSIIWFTQIRNNKCPYTDHWGTPADIFPDTESQTRTRWIRETDNVLTTEVTFT